MTEIVSCKKDVDTGMIRYAVETSDGDRYTVVHLVRKGMILERIYYVNYPTPVCISRREYAAHVMPGKSFQDIIAGRGRQQ